MNRIAYPEMQGTHLNGPLLVMDGCTTSAVFQEISAKLLAFVQLLLVCEVPIEHPCDTDRSEQNNGWDDDAPPRNLRGLLQENGH